MRRETWDTVRSGAYRWTGNTRLTAPGQTAAREYIGLQGRGILAYYKPGEELPGEDGVMPDSRRGRPPAGSSGTTSEGTPVSPVFAAAGKLAAWCEDGATVFAGMKWTREQWLQSFQDESTDVQSLLFVDWSGMHTGIPSAGE